MSHLFYDLREPEGQSLPLVFDGPHSGTPLPQDMGAALPPEVQLRGCDRYVGDLYGAAPARRRAAAWRPRSSACGLASGRSAR